MLPNRLYRSQSQHQQKYLKVPERNSIKSTANDKAIIPSSSYRQHQPTRERKTKAESVGCIPLDVRRRINSIKKDQGFSDRLVRSDRQGRENIKTLPQNVKLKGGPKGKGGVVAQKHFPVPMKAATTRTGRSDSHLAYDYSFELDEQRIEEEMMSRKSSLSLLEQKKLQWAQEREELNGLWSPWGRPTDAMSTSTTPSSNSVILSSSYANKLGLNTAQSEYHLPPISPAIVQQPRKSSLWATTDENTNPNFGSGNNPLSAKSNNENLRKSSLPICISTSAGELHFNGSNTVELKHQTHNAIIMSSSMHSNNNGWASFDEDTITSGYQSENNGFLSNGDGEYSRNGSGDYHSNRSLSRVEDQEQDYELESRGYLPRRSLKSGNKNSSRSRSEGGPKAYDENGSPTKGKNYDGKRKSNSKIVVHKILTENEDRQEYEYMINAMTEVHQDNLSGRSSYLYNSRSNPNLSHSGRVINAPPPAAMRSSITFGIDASNVADYREIERQERERWLNELEKQREEQRLRREMEREDRERPRWGDKGIGVGHFWEPAVSENARLPPPGSSRGDDDPTAQTTPAWLEKSLNRMENSKSPCSLHEMDRNRSQDTSPLPYSNNNNLLASPSPSNVDLRNVAGFSDTNDPNAERTFLRGQNVPCDPDVLSEKEKKRQAALEHQEAIRKQMEERQLKLKQEREKKIMEEKNEEERIARQQQLELERLEAERRKTGRGKDKVDEGNDFGAVYVDGADNILLRNSSKGERKNSRDEFAQSKSKALMRSVDDNTGRELAIRQSMTLPVLGESKSMNNIVEDVVSEEISSEEYNRVIATSTTMTSQDQSIMTELEDLAEVRTLTPTLQRSRSLITAKEFGTQTESSESNSGSSKNSATHRSHNCLTEKGKEKEGKKKKKEKPRWGENPVKKQYLKQSEKDPLYQQRLRRRMDRMKRREEEIVVGDTGTESEELNVPVVHRQIRIRKSDQSPPRSVAPMRAKVPLNNFNKNNGKEKSGRENNGKAQKQAQSSNSKTQIQKRNGGGRPLGRHTLTTNHILTSEESSGFSSPARTRDIGAGDSLDYEEYQYLSLAMHDTLPDINSKGNYVSEYMGELPPNLTKTTRKNSKIDLLPNKTSKASIAKTKGEEKSSRKTSISTSSSQNQNPPNNEMQYPPLQNRNPPSDEMQYESMQSRSPPADQMQYETMDNRNPPSDEMQYERRQSRNPPNDEMQYERMQSRNPPGEEIQYETMQSRIPPSSDEMQYEQRMKSRNPPDEEIQYETMQNRIPPSSDEMQYERRQSRNPPNDETHFERMMQNRNAPGEEIEYETMQNRIPPRDEIKYERRSSRNPQSDQIQYEEMESRIPPSNEMHYEGMESRKAPNNEMKYEKMQNRKAPSKDVQYERMQSRKPPMSMISQDSIMMSYAKTNRMNTIDLEDEPFNDAYNIDSRPFVRNPHISKLADSSTTESFETRASSPPVPALLKKMQMGFSPDETGRLSSLQNDIIGSPTHSRAGSRISTSGPKIDIDIAVTARPEFKQTIVEQSEETESSNTKEENETRAGTMESKSLESENNNGIDFYDVPSGGFDVVVGIDPKESARSNLSYRTLDRPLTNGSNSTDLSRQERFIYSVMSNDDVQAQLSARESELSEKGIIEFSVRLPAQSKTNNIYRHDMPGHKMAKKRMDGNNKQTSVESSLDDEYQDPLLSARRNCVRWLYSSDDSPKESVLTHLSYLKKGIMMQQQEWGVVPSDTEEEVYDSRR